MNINEIIAQLNNSDERTDLEVKRGSAIDRAILETICAFSNEPDLGGGTIVLGIKEIDDSLFPTYEIVGVENPDKLQKDLATQCADLFNIPVRPKISIENVNGQNVLVIEVEELSHGQKPIFFKKQGLPHGAYRRIGTTDQKCTEDDMYFFYGKEDGYDNSTIKDSDLNDINFDALDVYRKLRNTVNNTAEELNYDDVDLLRALNCIKKVDDVWKLTNTGLIVFGNKIALRRLMPMMRIDYIRLPGHTWIDNPDKRFVETLDMRGPIIEMVSRIIATIADDLPKGFVLKEGEVQAEGKLLLPTRVLREAVVNALIHRNYRINQPIQILRYSNRIEIINAGTSMKPEENIGEPGSVNRNPFIAAIFHDTNLAETKGSGFRTMQTLMKEADMMPPTFESNREKNNFTLRLLFHHFLNQRDLIWLSAFDRYNLNDNQKLAIVFIREVGAIDNITYRQLTGTNRAQAGTDLRILRKRNLIEQKSSKRTSYYLPFGDLLNAMVDKQPAMVDKQPAMVDKQPAMVDKQLTMVNNESNSKLDTWSQIPVNLIEKIFEIGLRSKDPKEMRNLILQLCAWRPLSSIELSKILQRSEKYIKNNYLQPLIKDGYIIFTIPEMITHPQQKYKTVKL